MDRKFYHKNPPTLWYFEKDILSLKGPDQPTTLKQARPLPVQDNKQSLPSIANDDKNIAEIIKKHGTFSNSTRGQWECKMPLKAQENLVQELARFLAVARNDTIFIPLTSQIQKLSETSKAENSTYTTINTLWGHMSDSPGVNPNILNHREAMKAPYKDKSHLSIQE